jgi:4-amino-4-deoxy-L-arabinose transferase-like glycosyltransferase
LLGLLIAALLATFLASRFARYQLGLRPDEPGAERVLQQFAQWERGDDTLFAWSRPEAALALFGFEGRPLLLELRLAATRPAGMPVAMLALAEHGRPYGSFPVAGSWRRYRLLLPPQATSERTLALSSTPFLPPGNDDRELGVALSGLRVVALAPRAWSLALVERPLFLGLLPALAILALWRGGKRPQATGARWLGALGLLLLLLAAVAAAYPLQSTYVLPTLWLLPALLLLPLLPSLLRRGAALVRLRAVAGWTLIGGLALALSGLLMVRLSLWPLAGLGLLLAGSAAAASALRPGARPLRGQAVGRGELVALLGITLVALALRFYRLDSLPLGLFRDEARHGLQALQIWENPAYRPVYVVYAAQLPALLFYLMAPVVGLLGASPWSARLVPALAGALTPLALWWFARPLWGARVALLAAGALAVSGWALHMSRWAFPVTLDPLLVILALACLWRALRGGPGVVYGLLAGVCGGLVVYTYHSGRVAPVLLAMAALIWLGQDARAWRRALPALLAALLGGLLTLTPLLLFVLDDFAGYMYRVERVSLFKDRLVGPHAPLAVLASNGLRYAFMWHLSGDPNARHNLPGAPMLDPLAGLLLLLGLWLALRRPTRSPTLLLLVWLVIGLLPGLLSGQAPHAMRSFGALAPACILVGRGLDALLRSGFATRAAARSGPPQAWDRGYRAAAIGLLLCSLAWASYHYFGPYARSRAVYTRFNVVETELGRALRGLATQSDPLLSGYRLFVDDGMIRRDVFEFVAHGLTLGQCGSAGCLPEPGERALLLIKGEANEQERAEALAALGNQGQYLGSGPFYPDGNGPIYLVYGRGPEAGQVYALLASGSFSR